MSTAAMTPDQMITEAGRILSDAGAGEGWPKDPHAQAAIGWAFGRLLECLDIHARLVKGSMDPYAVLAPDMAYWDDPEASAIGWAADEALEAAKCLRNRLAEWQRKGERP